MAVSDASGWIVSRWAETQRVRVRWARCLWVSEEALQAGRVVDGLLATDTKAGWWIVFIIPCFGCLYLEAIQFLLVGRVHLIQ